jgi:hypothetical protein
MLQIHRWMPRKTHTQLTVPVPSRNNLCPCYRTPNNVELSSSYVWRKLVWLQCFRRRSMTWLVQSFRAPSTSPYGVVPPNCQNILLQVVNHLLQGFPSTHLLPVQSFPHGLPHNFCIFCTPLLISWNNNHCS